MLGNNPGPGNVTGVLSFTMVFIYMGLGCVFLFTSLWVENYPKPTRTYIGLVLVAWGLFRGFMVWQKIRRNKNDDNDV